VDKTNQNPGKPPPNLNGCFCSLLTICKAVVPPEKENDVYHVALQPINPISVAIRSEPQSKLNIDKSLPQALQTPTEQLPPKTFSQILKLISSDFSSQFYAKKSTHMPIVRTTKLTSKTRTLHLLLECEEAIRERRPCPASATQAIADPGLQFELRNPYTRTLLTALLNVAPKTA
jgi:hypothetical protein